MAGDQEAADLLNHFPIPVDGVTAEILGTLQGDYSAAKEMGCFIKKSSDGESK